jgi:hypothetical protein
VRLRIPSWLEKHAELAVNGKRVEASRPGTFAAIERNWRRGDTIDLRLPFSPRTVPIEERAPNTVAAMYGPVMLTAIDPPTELAATAAALSSMRAIDGRPLEFDCETLAGKVRMRPFYQVQREAYSTYFRRTVSG